MIPRTHLLQLFIGLMIWGLWFITIYSFLSVICAAKPPVTGQVFTWVNAILLVATFLTIAILWYLANYCWQIIRNAVAQTKALHRFILWIGLAVNIAGVILTLTIGVMVLFLPPCL